MKSTKVLMVIIAIIYSINIAAHSRHYFEHYSTENGLPQFTVTDMIQDHKGFMWFSTWDGFCKFDGKAFRSFKVREGDAYKMESNRIQHIYEDTYGNIWLHSYDDKAHCFDPYTESFKDLPLLYEYQQGSFKLKSIEICPSGNVWLLSEANGCICITDSLLGVQAYNSEKGRLKGNRVYKVFEDAQQNSWILTNNGLNLIEQGKVEPIPFFFENNQDCENQSFHAAIEFEQEIWFASNNGRIWKYSKTSQKFTLFQLPSNSILNSLHSISTDEVLITTSTDGLFIYNFRENEFNHYNSTTVKELTSNKIRSLLLDSHKQFWFETEELGIYKMNIESRSIKYYVVKIDNPAINAIPPASKIVEDINGLVWMQPRGGGFSFYNQTSDKLEPFYNDESSSNWRFSNILHSIYSDKQGNLWFCTRSHGLEKVSFDNNNFKTIKISTDLRSTIANDVRAVIQDKDKRLWVATKDQHLSIYDEHYNHIGNLSKDGKIGANHSFLGIVYSMLQDDEGNIWVGTRTDGLYKIKQTNSPYHYQIEHFRKDPNDIYSLSEDVIYTIFQDSQKNIWVGTYGGGLNLVKSSQTGKTIFINHKNNLKEYPIANGYRIRYISENKFRNICIGTTTGLIMFPSSFSSPDEIEYKYYTRIPGDNESLGNNDIHGICNTQQGEMYLATFGGGLNKVSAYDSDGFPTKFKSYTIKDGLPMDVCLAVIEDKSGKLWISMENNLSKFDPDKESFETFTEIKRLMAQNSFSEASTCRLANNDLIFGFSEGLLCFSPEKICNSSFKPYIALSEFRLHNQQVPIGKKDSPLEKSIDDISKLTLSRKQNSFSIEYAALDFVLASNISYAYKLEGFDKDWVYVHKKRIANYTNIPHGNYVFKIKSTNSEGIWVENERTLPIKILPSFWETPWSIIIYIIVSGIFIYLVIRILFTFYRLRKNVEMEKYLSEMKLRFFTDISHEIRTPLTMISAPVDFLLMDEEIPSKAKVHLNSIHQNANRILRLVNQILDFRKIQQTKLRVQETDIGLFIRNVYTYFEEVAQKNQIQFQYINQAPNEKVWIAPDSLEIIMMNLLSNAFKYTPNGKSITITVKGEEKQVLIKIADEGSGISKEKQKELFTRFISFNEDKSKPSTGIGLSIVKDLIEKHSGKIQLESNVGKGSTFTISILKGVAHFNKEVEFIETHKPSPPNKSDSFGAFENEIPPKKHEKEYSVLVIEDNQELRSFIRTILEHDYMVIEAEDGIDGLEKAENEHPDFIVSDIMMPHLDGVELLKRLKENISTSHIPVILLTAKTAIENKLEGLINGADDYITKPFSVQYFRARIENLLEQRKRIQEAFRSQLTHSKNANFEPLPLSISSQDEVLINKVIEIIDQNMDNSEFTVDDLSTMVNMSRSVFSNKVKSLTGLSPFNFVRDIRLKRAAQLLSSGEFMVKEVAFMIGISDTKYFRKIFKAKYGVTPQEYKQGEKNILDSE